MFNHRLELILVLQDRLYGHALENNLYIIQ